MKEDRIANGFYYTKTYHCIHKSVVFAREIMALAYKLLLYGLSKKKKLTLDSDKGCTF